MTTQNIHLGSEGFLSDVKTFKLENGLTSYLKRDASLPLVSIQVWVNVGSIDEDEKTRGLSHFLEHLIFKGSEKYPGDAISRLVETNGGVINAGTSKEYTVYFIDIQKDAYSKVMDILADAMHRALIPPEEVEKERLVVIEEIKRHDDNPEGVLYDIFSENLFTTSQHRHRIIGDENVIRNVTRDEILNYYERHYQPKNMIVAASGDISASEFEAALKKTFGVMTKGSVVFKPKIKESVHHGNKEVKVKKNVAHLYSVAGFLGPDIYSDEQFAAEVAATIIGAGISSRLYQNLREKKQIVYSVGSSFYSQKGDGVFFISAVLESKKLKQYKAEIEKEIRRCLSAPPSDEEIKRAVSIIKSHWLFHQEKIHDQAGLLGYWGMQGNLKILDEYMDKISAVTKEDVLNFFRYADSGVVWAVVEPL